MKKQSRFERVAWIAMPAAILVLLCWAILSPGRTSMAMLAGLLVVCVVMLILARLMTSFASAILTATMVAVVFHTIYAIAGLVDSHDYSSVGEAFGNWADDLEPFAVITLGGITLIVSVIISLINEFYLKLKNRKKPTNEPTR